MTTNLPIQTYGDLVGVVQLTLNRQDAATLAMIPQWVDLAEKRIQRTQKWFEELYSVANNGPLLITAQPQPLPNYVRRVLTWSNSTGLYFQALPVVPLELIHDLQQRNLNASGVPQYLSVINETVNTPIAPVSEPLTIDRTDLTIDQTVIGIPTNTSDTAPGPLMVLLWPPPALNNQSPISIDLLYVKKLPPLLLNGVNWLLQEHPDVYLYATLVESAPFLQHDDRLQMWEALYQQRSQEVTIETENRKYGATPRRVRLPVVLGY